MAQQSRILKFVFTKCVFVLTNFVGMLSLQWEGRTGETRKATGVELPSAGANARSSFSFPLLFYLIRNR